LFSKSHSIFEKQKADGPSKKLVGFQMIDKGIARHDYEIKDEAGNLIGKVTSGTQSPSLGKAIGMGYVDTAYAALGNSIYISIRNNALKAEIVKIPFT
ncbi:MAG: glycine cleavage T C-terminal barrel domain-containing protein, partial [Ferruginibacter sp.]